MTSQKVLRAALDDAATPQARLQAALDLLAVTESRSHIDAVLLTLESQALVEHLSDAHRDIIREKCWFYYNAPPAKDKAAIIREKLTRLLVHINNPEDRDLYLRGVLTYYRQPVDDVAQNLRAAALAGLATCDRELACLYATRLLGEPDSSVFNCEPSITAIEVLTQFDQTLPVYQFILRSGVDFAPRRGEAVARAFEALPDDFPPELLIDAAEIFIEIDASVILTGIIDVLVKREDDALHELIERIIDSTADDDLHGYGTIMMATSHKPMLIASLYQMARLSPRERIHNFIRAIELTQHSDRDDTLALLEKRL